MNRKSIISFGVAAAAMIGAAGLALASPNGARAGDDEAPILSEADRALIREKCGGDTRDNIRLEDDGVLVCDNGRRIEDPEVRALFDRVSARARAKVDEALGRSDGAARAGRDATRRALAALERLRMDGTDGANQRIVILSDRRDGEGPRRMRGLRLDCDGEGTSVSEESGDDERSERTRVVICGDGTGDPAARAERLERALSRIVETEHLSAEHRARIEARLRETIEQLRDTR